MKSTVECPYVEAHGVAGKQRPTTITIRSTGTGAYEGSALGLALAWHKQHYSSGSAHYVVDEKLTYQTTWDDYQVCGQPRGALVVAVCVDFLEDRDDFLVDPRFASLLGTARLVAALTQKYKIPVRYLDARQKAKWSKFKTRRRGGLVLDISWGVWPKTLFLDLVENEIIKLKERDG